MTPIGIQHVSACARANRSGRDDATRLVTRLRIFYDWTRPGQAVFSLLLNEFGDFPMMRRMLLRIKQRAENMAATPGAAALKKTGIR